MRSQVSFTITGKGSNRKLVITPTEDFDADEMREAVDDHGLDQAFYDLIERQLCNGWSNIPPEDCGALTDRPIISMDFTMDDDGRYQPIFVEGTPNPIVFAPSELDCNVRGLIYALIEYGKLVFDGYEAEREEAA